jgi:hypothetical protein
MPSVSKKQHNFMAAIAKNPKFAKKVGIPRSVGEEFLTADKGKKFKEGGEMRKTVKKFGSGGMSAKPGMPSFAKPYAQGIRSVASSSALPSKGTVSRTPQAPRGTLPTEAKAKFKAMDSALRGLPARQSQTSTQTRPIPQSTAAANAANAAKMQMKQSANTKAGSFGRSPLDGLKNLPKMGGPLGKKGTLEMGKPVGVPNPNFKPFGKTSSVNTTTDADMARKGNAKPFSSVASKLGGIGASLGKKMGMKHGGMAHSDMKMDKKVVKKAVGMHEKQLHGGKKSDMSKLKSGGMAVKKMARGGGIEKKGKTQGTMIKMRNGGKC